jgi:hypothetical protein
VRGFCNASRAKLHRLSLAGDVSTERVPISREYRSTLFQETAIMSTASRFAGLSIVVLTFMAMVRISPGTTLPMFVDFPSAIWILGIVCGGLLIAFPLSTILRAVWSGFQPPCNRDDLLVDVSVFRRAR